MAEVKTERVAWHLDAVRAALEDEVYRAAVATAYDVERHAKHFAPVDTGALRADIHTEVGPSPKGTHKVISGDTIAYAAPVHNGHVTRSGSTVSGTFYLTKGADAALAAHEARMVRAVERASNAK